MDLVIELDNEGRLWVSGSDDTTREEAWLGKFRRQQKVDNSCVGQTLAFRHTASSVAVLRPACR